MNQYYEILSHLQFFFSQQPLEREQRPVAIREKTPIQDDPDDLRQAA